MESNRCCSFDFNGGLVSEYNVAEIVICFDDPPAKFQTLDFVRVSDHLTIPCLRTDPACCLPCPLNCADSNSNASSLVLQNIFQFRSSDLGILPIDLVNFPLHGWSGFKWSPTAVLMLLFLLFFSGSPYNSGDCRSYNNNILLAKNANDLSWSFVGISQSEYPISRVFTIHVNISLIWRQMFTDVKVWLLR